MTATESLVNRLPTDMGGLSADPERLKKPWQIHNTRRLDAMRDELERLPLSEIEKSVLLTSLMLALDCVDSTLGHYASYLREWSPRSRATGRSDPR